MPSSDRRQTLLFLAGAIALLVLALRELPRLPELLHAPETPYDRNPSIAMAAEWRLFTAAAKVIPPGARICAIAEPRNPARETWLHRDAVALLPGRTIFAAAIFAVPTYSEDQAEYWIVAGPPPASPPGDRLLAVAEGTVWRRRPR